MDKYEKVRVLGKGSFGSAILIKRKDDNALFVVKEIPMGKMTKKEREDARKECTVLQQLHHPNIVRYIEQFENHNNLYIVMEYCNDSDLGEKVKKCQGAMKESTILYYFSQVCLAMEYLHSKHILHRDIKTMNVFLMKNGAVKLGDFGIATMLQNTMAVAKTVCGTPYYFSPELCRKKPYNSKSDMWSLGILLYECATGGRHPFDGNNIRQLMERIVKTPHAPFSSNYSLEFRNLVDWCLQKDPANRPSIKQVLAYPLVRRSLEHLERNLLLATQCKIRLKDLIDYEASIPSTVLQSVQPYTPETHPTGLRPGQAAAVAVSRAEDSSRPSHDDYANSPINGGNYGINNSNYYVAEAEGGAAKSAHRGEESTLILPASSQILEPSTPSGEKKNPSRREPYHAGARETETPPPSEALKKMMEKVSLAQNIRRRIVRQEIAGPNARKTNLPAPASSNDKQRSSNVLLKPIYKPIYRSPYAQPMRDPSRVGRSGVLNDADPYSKVKDNPGSRFVRLKVLDRPVQRAPQPITKSTANPRKWNQVSVMPSPSTPTTRSGRLLPTDDESDILSSSASNVMWHAPPSRRPPNNSIRSPTRNGYGSSPRLEPVHEIDFKKLHMNRLKMRQPVPQRLAPIHPKRASTAGDNKPPPSKRYDLIQRQDTGLAVGGFLESETKTSDMNTVSGRSKSDGGYDQPIGRGPPTELQLLETYSTFETAGVPLVSSGKTSVDTSGRGEDDKTTSTNAEFLILSEGNSNQTQSEGETREEDGHEGDSNSNSFEKRTETATDEMFSSTGDDDAELIDVNYDFEGAKRGQDNFLLPTTPRGKVRLSALPSVDFGNRNADLYPVHLPLKGEHIHTNNRLRHFSTEAALYAGMSREAPTLDEELYLQRQKRRSLDTVENVLPSVLETLRSTREEEVKSNTSPLALLNLKRVERGSYSDDLVSIQPVAVLPLSLGSLNQTETATIPMRNSVSVRSSSTDDLSKIENSPLSKEYNEMLKCLGKLLYRQGDADDDEGEEEEEGKSQLSDVEAKSKGTNESNDGDTYSFSSLVEERDHNAGQQESDETIPEEAEDLKKLHDKPYLEEILSHPPPGQRSSEHLENIISLKRGEAASEQTAANEPRFSVTE